MSMRSVDPVLMMAPWLESNVGRLSLLDAATRLAELYRLLIAPDQVVELRALHVSSGRGRPHTEAGFFDGGHLAEMAKTALELSLKARGVYFTLNPVHADLLARRCNRVDWANDGELTKEKDILARRWLLIDCDPVRDPHISATDEEKAAALATARGVRAFLHQRAWPDPILADSGNGFHLLYRVDLHADDKGMIERILHALAKQFDCDKVKIDRKVFNASRICKLPGTWARKGDNMPMRPHRQAQLLEVPAP
jgi:hypothetical protein